MKYDVFISYSRKDTAVADRICDTFDKAGISYFIDRQDIGGAYEFPKILSNAILDSTLFLYLASRNSYESKFTSSEITFAFNKKEKNCMLPYIIDGSKLPIDQEFIFSAINWRNITEHPIETTLVQDLLRLLGRNVRTDTPAPAPQTKELNAQELYEKGKSLFYKKQYKEALPFIQQSAENGVPKAQYYLGLMYFYGQGVTKDCTEAVKWYTKAAEQEDAVAQYHLGEMYHGGIVVNKDYTEAVKLYRKAAEKGNQKAQYMLAYMYSNGYGVIKEYTEAVKWYRKAAEQGNADAQHALGCIYQEGKGVGKNYTEAVKWFRKAAEQGVAYSQVKLGDMYRDGYGVTKDKTEAAKWYRQAAEQGNRLAIASLNELGFIYKLFSKLG